MHGLYGRSFKTTPLFKSFTILYEHNIKVRLKEQLVCHSEMANGDSTSPKDVSAPTEPRLVTVQLLPVHNPRNDNRATATRVTGTIQIASGM